MKYIINESQYFNLLSSTYDNRLVDMILESSFWGRSGAGAVIVCRETGRLLIPKRSAFVNEPGTWGTWGGAIDEGENPREAVKRELEEESGYYGEMKIVPLHVFEHNSGFKYYNFLILVEEEFEPQLNWETERYGWFNLNELPKPLHFGFKGILTNSGDMSKIQAYANSIEESKGHKKTTLNESVSDVVFHYTSPRSLLNILKTNKIYLTPSYGIEADRRLNYNKLFSLSLTTARNPATGYHSSGKNLENAKGRIRLEMNGRELNYNYKSKHVDYWQYPRTKDYTKNGGSYDEMEERIISDKNEMYPASRYIKTIEIFIYEEQIKVYHKIKQMADSLNIPCYFYNNGKDFSFSIKKNSVELPEYEDESDKEEYVHDEMSSGYVYKIAAIASYKDESVKNKIIETAKENKLDTDEVNNSIEENIKNFEYYYLRSKDKYSLAELTETIGNAIKMGRNSSNRFIRSVIKIIGYDIKKRSAKSIRDYIEYKAYIGIKTQKIYNKELFDFTMKKIDAIYNDNLTAINEYSFYLATGDYHYGGVTTVVPKFKYEMDNLLLEIKRYYKNKILSNNDMFRYTFYFSYLEVYDELGLDKRKYEFANDTIDYDESTLDESRIKRHIRFIISNVSDEIENKIKEIKEEYIKQNAQI